MPPVYKKITPIKVFDGSEAVDFRQFGLNAEYHPNVIPIPRGNEIFNYMNGRDSPLRDHTYVGNFNRIITPARKVHASVPIRPFYRFKGKDIIPIISDQYNQLIDELKSKYAPDGFTSNASISNLYRYNGKDCIAPHTDDEKFLGIGNYEGMPDISTVITFTFLADPDQPMVYLVGDPLTGKGYGIKLRHGSMFIQGNVLHEVPPMYSKTIEFGRLSITLRQLDESCPCRKISCPWICGPSNYLYYTGSYILKSATIGGSTTAPFSRCSLTIEPISPEPTIVNKPMTNTSTDSRPKKKFILKMKKPLTD
jgi:hypothetical protein